MKSLFGGGQRLDFATPSVELETLPPCLDTPAKEQYRFSRSGYSVHHLHAGHKARNSLRRLPFNRCYPDHAVLQQAKGHLFVPGPGQRGRCRARWNAGEERIRGWESDAQEPALLEFKRSMDVQYTGSFGLYHREFSISEKDT
jgi:hypothetical protein